MEETVAAEEGTEVRVPPGEVEGVEVEDNRRRRLDGGGQGSGTGHHGADESGEGARGGVEAEAAVASVTAGSGRWSRSGEMAARLGRAASPDYTPATPSGRAASPDYTPATPSSRAASPDYTPSPSTPPPSPQVADAESRSSRCSSRASKIGCRGRRCLHTKTYLAFFSPSMPVV
ncbi:hypothetical protein EJB05_35021, partial [Eragrostis curvula]